jgi:hypothetical protein
LNFIAPIGQEQAVQNEAEADSRQLDELGAEKSEPVLHSLRLF